MIGESNLLAVFPTTPINEAGQSPGGSFVTGLTLRILLGSLVVNGWLISTSTFAQQEAGFRQFGEGSSLARGPETNLSSTGSPANNIDAESNSEAGSDASELDDLDSLLDSDVSQLRNTQVAPSLQMEVSTVSRQKSTIGKSPAAVFVVTREMIHRSGARSIPEILRMVPGLHVAKVGSNRWAVSSRGFVSIYNQQLLVQIDGRSIYTPVFGGVVWSWHDLLLEDIERIEVIRGPGSTVWGANAVNGVINIITRSAADTHGHFIEAGGGTEELAFTGFRSGGTSQNGVNWRISGKWFERDAGFQSAGLEFDDWHQASINTRMDWESGCGDQYTLQAGAFSGQKGAAFAGATIPFALTDTPDAGGNLLFRWTRPLGEDSDTSVQFWADHYNTGSRFDIVDGTQTTVDLDVQHRRKVGDRHRLVMGLGYRTVWDQLNGGPVLPLLGFLPVERTADNASVFIQDEIELRPDKLYFTIGTKLSNNSYTGVEVQPSARLLSVIDDRTVAWAAFSRAVRVPSRSDTGVVLQVLPAGALTILGNPNADSEPLYAYEFGVRRQPAKHFSWDFTAFYNDYDRLLASIPTSPTTLMSFNVLDTTGYGVELSSQLDLTCNWKLKSWYTYLDLEDKTFIPTGLPSASPRNQAYLMSTYNPNRCTDLDLIVRYVDDIREQAIGAYIEADLRFAWRPRPNVEVSLVGQNLLDSSHEEFVSNPFVPEIATMPQRGVYGMVQIRY